MLADRTLLTVTLAATFAAGGTAGWAAHARRADVPVVPTSAEHVYAPQLRTLREEKGFSDEEIAEATRLHQQYLDSYQQWWKAFLEAHAANLDVVDRKFELDLKALERRVEARREGEKTR